MSKKAEIFRLGYFFDFAREYGIIERIFVH